MGKRKKKQGREVMGIGSDHSLVIGVLVGGTRYMLGNYSGSAVAFKHPETTEKLENGVARGGIGGCGNSPCFSCSCHKVLLSVHQKNTSLLNQLNRCSIKKIHNSAVLELPVINSCDNFPGVEVWSSLSVSRRSTKSRLCKV